MTDDQYGELVEFLGVKFDRIDGRFDSLETRFEGLETRFDGLETRFEGLETRFDGLEIRFDGLETRFDGLETRFGGLETRFDGLATRTVGLEVGHEQLRDDIRQVAEGVTANSERIERLEATMNRRFDRLEEGWWVRFDDHERRIRKLEG